MAAWDQFANHDRQEVSKSGSSVLSKMELQVFVAGATAQQLKDLIDSGDLTAKEIGEAQLANKAARAKANPS